MMTDTLGRLESAMPNKKQFYEQPERELPPGVKLLRVFEGHDDRALCVAFDPEGRTLASGSGDSTVNLWEVADGKLLRVLKGHRNSVVSLAFDPEGRTLVSGSPDGTAVLWEVANGKLLRSLRGHTGDVSSVAFDPKGNMLVSGSGSTVTIWESANGKLLRILEAQQNGISSLAFDPDGQRLVTGGEDGTVKVWEVVGGKLLRTLEGHRSGVLGVAFEPTGQRLASAGEDQTVRVWEMASGKLLHILEGHTGSVDAVAFSADGRLLASKSNDGTVRLWSCGIFEPAAVIPAPASSYKWPLGIAFHPALALLASVGSKPGAPPRDLSRLVHLWELDLDVLVGSDKRTQLSSGRVPEILAHGLGSTLLNVGKTISTSSEMREAADALRPRFEPREGKQPMKALRHTTAKIVLVGDSGVGKTGLGWRLAHGVFREHSSTHGQQFWVLSELSTRRSDDTECEAILWDLAGQPDYRLTHALFLDDADLALVLFDPTDSRDPLHGVEFWLKQLTAGQAQPHAIPEKTQDMCPTILVGARADRGEARLTQEELDAFCYQRGILGGYLSTSASTGLGLKELLRRMQAQIPWDQKPATVTTVTFKHIKDYVLGLKENRRRRKVLISSQELRKQIERTDKPWQFTDAEMMTAAKHLSNYGYVRVLRTSKSDERILLAPELLNNLAASFVLEARRNPKGLGSLEETRLLAGEYPFRELEKLSGEERDVLLDSAALLFLEHNICFRETDLSGNSYLVFPDLINLKKPPLEDEQSTEDGVAYTINGAVENAYASLVVLLGYTPMFTRTNQWRNEARYEVDDGLICGFRQDGDRDGELDLVIYFGANVGRPVRTLFQGLFESFLARRNLSVFRYEPVVCSNGHVLNRAVVREELRLGANTAFCPKCGQEMSLPNADEPIQLRQDEQRKVTEQRWRAEQRSRFEQAVFQLASYVESQKIRRPECFISYAWGDPEQERWVERSLATDLRKAGLIVVLDRWENERVGATVSRFVERIEKCDRVIVVGTPSYRRKYENKDTSTGYVVAAEVDLISNKLLGAGAQKESVMPVLLAGESTSSFPPLLHSRVFGDFRDARNYFITAFDLILDTFGIGHSDPAVAHLRESLREREMR
jgi:WD40 repeat protein/GTPase SAR1 family protein